MQNTSDQEIIAAILKGDKNSYGLLIDRHQDKAFRLSLSIVKSEANAEEIVHEAFIKAYENLVKFRKDAKFSTWFYRIVYNLSISLVRFDKRFNDNSIIESENDLHATELNQGFDYLLKEEQKRYIQKALSCLSPLDRMLIESYYLEEMDMKTLSVITGETLSNIKVKLFRSRKKLFIELESCLKDELLSLIQKV